MAIPRDIERKHILLAILDIDEQRRMGTFPPKRASHGCYVEVAGIRYPPKYLISLAGIHAIGRELPSREFNGTDARHFLEVHGFRVEGEPFWPTPRVS